MRLEGDWRLVERRPGGKIKRIGKCLWWMKEEKITVGKVREEICGKIRKNGPSGILKFPGKMILEKSLKSKLSCQTHFKDKEKERRRVQKRKVVMDEKV